MERKIIFATGNEGKMTEIRAILAGAGFLIRSMKEAGIAAWVDENGTTFEENAVIKAKEISAYTNEIVLADDSGLEIDYLNKEPGIYSARYAGVDTPYSVKNQMLLDRLLGVPQEKRTARFVCVIAAALPNGEIITARGTFEGYIAFEATGFNGFGYDPIFFVPEYNCTSAQLPTDLKNQLSHRGKALCIMRDKLNKSK
jgi:XTP/dITP diphosphohydrolase